MPAGQKLENAVADLVGDRPHFIDGKPGRIGEVPVEVSLAGEDRAGTTAPHGDHDIGGLHLADSERLGMLAGDLEADFGHGLHDGGIEFIGGCDPTEVTRARPVASWASSAAAI